MHVKAIFELVKDDEIFVELLQYILDNIDEAVPEKEFTSFRIRQSPLRSIEPIKKSS
jgi:hypothetical protein